MSEENTVNFIEAVNSGKRFKYNNPESDYWTWQGDRLLNCKTGGSFLAVIDDINSRFILEEKKVTITEARLNIAIENFVNDVPFPCILKLKKELGLL